MRSDGFSIMSVARDEVPKGRSTKDEVPRTKYSRTKSANATDMIEKPSDEKHYSAVRGRKEQTTSQVPSARGLRPFFKEVELWGSGLSKMRFLKATL